MQTISIKVRVEQADKMFEHSVRSDQVERVLRIVDVDGSLREFLGRISGFVSGQEVLESGLSNGSEGGGERRTRGELVETVRQRLSDYKLRLFGVDYIVAITHMLSEISPGNAADRDEIEAAYEDIFPGSAAFQGTLKSCTREGWIQREVDGKFRLTQSGRKRLKPRIK